MATQVETLLPNNALLHPEDPDNSASVEQAGPEADTELDPSTEESTLQEKENLEAKPDGKKKELKEAPPPRVNPWTKKLNAVSMNGQNPPTGK